MRVFDKDNGDVSQLVETFFSNNPYYPHPVTNDSLYNIFKQSYITSCPGEYRACGALFLEAIEARYAEKTAIIYCAECSIHLSSAIRGFNCAVWQQNLDNPPLNTDRVPPITAGAADVEAHYTVFSPRRLACLGLLLVVGYVPAELNKS